MTHLFARGERASACRLRSVLEVWLLPGLGTVETPLPLILISSKQVLSSSKDPRAATTNAVPDPAPCLATPKFSDVQPGWRLPSKIM